MRSVFLILEIIFNVPTFGYFLGETPGQSGYIRCWRNGNLLESCPPELNLEWDFPYEQQSTWYETIEYSGNVTFSWTPELVQYIVKKDGNMVSHVNIHACKKSVGACTPSVKANDIDVTHQPALKGDGPMFQGKIALVPGEWVIIAHGRLFLNDSRSYAAGGCVESTITSETWKLDAAIGMRRVVVFLPTGEPGYVIWVKIGCIILAFMMLVFFLRQVNKFMTSDGSSMEKDERMIREGRIELTFLSTLLVMDMMDIMSTCYATYTCFGIAGDQVIIVVLFCVILVFEFASNI